MAQLNGGRWVKGKMSFTQNTDLNSWLIKIFQENKENLQKRWLSRAKYKMQKTKYDTKCELG